MTDALDRATLIQLARRTGFPAVSLYLPAHMAGDGRVEDPIRLKNLVSAAHTALRSAGMRAPDADTLLAPAMQLVSDTGFWNTAGAEGVALFLSPGTTLRFALDTPMPELAVVGDRFSIRPLLEAARGLSSFWVLALSMGGVRLYHGRRHGLDEVPIPGAPTSLADELKYDEHHEELQSHATMSGATPAHGHTAQEFHGHGGGKDVADSNLERYLHDVDAALRGPLGGNGVPLVLFGVREVLSAFKGLSERGAAATAEVDGSPDELSVSRLHSEAVAALEPQIALAEAAAVDDFAEKTGTALASSDIAEILPAVQAGRVKTLIFDGTAGPFGHFDPETQQLEMCPARTTEVLSFQQEPPEGAPEGAACWDLVDLAAAETLLHGGHVLAYSGESAPVAGVAAVMRY